MLNLEKPQWLENVTEAQMAAIRYVITSIGILLTALNIVDTSVWDQLLPGLVALVTVAWGVWQTKKLEDERDAAVESLQVARAQLQAGGAKASQ